MPNVVTNACKRFSGDAKIFADVSIQMESSKKILTIFVCRRISRSYLSTKVNANISILVIIIIWKIIHHECTYYGICQISKTWGEIDQKSKFHQYTATTVKMVLDLYTTDVTSYPVIHSIRSYIASGHT